MQPHPRPIAVDQEHAVEATSLIRKVRTLYWFQPHVTVLFNGVYALSLNGFASSSVHSDSPLALALAAVQAIPVLTGTNGTGFEWMLYTGDLASHEPDNQNSRYDRIRPLACLNFA